MTVASIPPRAWAYLGAVLTVLLVAWWLRSSGEREGKLLERLEVAGRAQVDAERARHAALMRALQARLTADTVYQEAKHARAVVRIIDAGHVELAATPRGPAELVAIPPQVIQRMQVDSAALEASRAYAAELLRAIAADSTLIHRQADRIALLEELKTPRSSWRAGVVMGALGTIAIVALAHR